MEMGVQMQVFMPMNEVIHFDLPQERDPEKLRFGLDTQCPDDIDVVSIELVSEEFHARYNNIVKLIQSF